MNDTSRNGWRLEKLISFLLSLLFLLPFVAQAGTAPRVAAAGLYLSQPDTGEQIPAITLSTDVHLVVSGPAARATMRQVFLNGSRDCVEGTYILPLADGAAVDSVRLTIGGRVIVREIQEKMEGRDESRSPSAAERYSANPFRLAIAGMLPGEEAVVEIGWRQRAERTRTGGSISIPVAIAPPVVPPAERRRPALPEDTPLPQFIISAEATSDPGITVRIESDAGAPLSMVRSPSHPAAVVEAARGGGWRVRARSVAPAPDLVVHWDVLPLWSRDSPHLAAPGGRPHLHSRDRNPALFEGIQPEMEVPEVCGASD